MLGNVNVLLFCLAAWALILTPGPDMIYVITRGIGQGRSAGLLSAAGVTSGILVHTLLAALGIAVVLQTSELAFMLVKYLGAFYLIYLGVKTILARGQLALGQTNAPIRKQALYSQGLLSNVFNPKVALFFWAFLPQFIVGEPSSITLPLIGLGLIFALFTFTFLSLVGYFSGHIGVWLNERPGINANMRWITGSVMIGLGVRLALTKRV
ncbi:LysE family translocator [Pelolinea submarina]|uniref:Threonine/homoserine/homoserine lactone efflux protein n=1 Tax=Pelolinea submarina TaxID=913107 RepID=A0A347ZWV9_9CHLR|nr:LysE family translocator [Pelolinea submarina]REG05533.1 threonine/homoserine/homoserine lactone efflux protein [Pelolinea submarina]BBB49790.1 hypothetical protein Pelsub_P3021 [Pelolinea submarina]